MQNTIFIIENLDCANCGAKMEAQISQLPQVEEASLTFSTRQLRVTAPDPLSLLPQMEQIVQSIEPEATIHPAEDKKEVPDPPASTDHPHTEKKHMLYSLLSGAGFFLIGLLWGWLNAPFTSALAHIAAYLVLGSPVLITAAKKLLRGHVLDENFLMSIATIGAFVLGDFAEAVGIMLFYRIGEYFEHMAVKRSRSQIMEAVDLRPEVVTRLRGDAQEVIPAEDAAIGDILLILPGERIPLDGTVLSGESRIDTAPITGEPVPVQVGTGSSVISGCINTSGQLTIQVDKVLSESMVSRILHSVENAAANKPKVDRFITRFAQIYTPVVVALAVTIALAPSILTGNWEYWVYTALSFLVMSCPCALVLSVPLAFFCGIGVAGKHGILFKGGLSIEALANVKVAALDKTGTLTNGDFAVQKVACSDEAFTLCAGCEQHSTHPIAVSIVAAAKECALPLQKPDTMEEIPGRGIRAQVGARQVLCGNEKLMEEAGISVTAEENAAGTYVYIAIDGVLAGNIHISDTVKEDAPQAVAQIKALGVAPCILTGDDAIAAKAVANQLQIGQVHARLLPEEKLERMQKIRAARGSILFVGDGINDAPVLAGADVGAAMGSGADAAIEAADVVYLTSQANAIPRSISIAKQTKQIATQNIVVALVIKAIVMILGLLGHASMWLAVFADSGVAMLCVLNSIRLLYQKKK